MHLEIKKHDGPSRLGWFHYDGCKIKTPNFFSVLTKNWTLKHDIYITSYDNSVKSAPVVLDYGSLLIEKEIKKFGILPRMDVGFDVPRDIAQDAVLKTVKFAERYPNFGAAIVGSKYKDLREECAEKLKDRPLLAVSNGDRLVKNPRLMVEVITTIREMVSPNSAIYLQGAPPHLFYLLSYMGVDLFDSIDCIAKAWGKKMVTSRGYLSLEKIDELPCSCKICRENTPEDLYQDVNKLVQHNFDTALKIMSEIRVAMKQDELRNLVEERSTSSVNSMVALRLLDMEKGDFLERYTRVS
ncbi:MAG: tRNA-guanine transglycosylase [Candidatus Hydrothermarchaeales archaeon]